LPAARFFPSDSVVQAQVLSPAGQIAMLADQAEEALLVAEYGM
jgi:hypothetical protein